MAHVGAAFAKAAQTLGVTVLTPEYEIVLALVDFPNLTAEQLQDQSSLSRAGFFNTIERLKSWEIIVSMSDSGDRRRRIYRLSDEMRETILHRFIKYRADFIDREGHGRDGTHFITKELTARRVKGLDYFTCEFKILFYLFLNSNLPNHAVKSLIDASETKFHTSLKVLLENNLILVASEAADRRVRLYNISCLARLVMQKLHADIFEWLDGSEPAALPAVPDISNGAILTGATERPRFKASPLPR